MHAIIMLGVAICPGPGGVAEIGVHYIEVANQAQS
jgi:hypothetical protein